MKYINRIVDSEIKKKMNTAGAIEIKGPKWCGKTTSAKQIAKTTIEMQHPEKGKQYIEIAKNNPALLLEGDKPLLIDEWQIVPALWNAIRYQVDSQNKFGLYLLTGSATPNNKVNEDVNYLHTGVGRFATVKMKPFTLMV